MSCGHAWSFCCQQANIIRWDATDPECPTDPPCMPSSCCCALACSGRRRTPPASVLPPPRTGAFVNGSKQACSLRLGSKVCGSEKSCTASIGDGWRSMAWTPQAPSGWKKTGPNPCHRGKSGARRSLLTDGARLPLAIMAAPANRHDVTRVAETLSQALEQPWQPCLPRRKKPHTRKTSQKEWRRGYSARTPRWVVERSHRWLNCSRRLLVRWEKREDIYLAMLHFAYGLITWRTALSK